MHGYYYYHGGGGGGGGGGGMVKPKEGVAEVDDSTRYAELPGRDAHGTYPFNGPAEMDPRGRPAELSHHAMPAELDSAATTAGGWRY